MQNALLLHGTDGNSQINWFPWLKEQLEAAGYKVWCPDLPNADQPDLDIYIPFILSNNEWNFDSESIIVGHSSGAVAALGLLERLPESSKIKATYLVGAFKNDLGWESLKKLYKKPFNFAKIRTKSAHFTFIHSDNDPYCPLVHAEYLSQKIGGELIVKPGQKHFGMRSGGPQYKAFPFLLELILADNQKNGAD
jgi:predicted alpha/beta hydrolase family esterase